MYAKWIWCWTGSPWHRIIAHGSHLIWLLWQLENGPRTKDIWILKYRSIFSLILNINLYYIISDSDVLKPRSIIYIFLLPLLSAFLQSTPRRNDNAMLLPLRLEARLLILSPMHLYVSCQQAEAWRFISWRLNTSNIKRSRILTALTVRLWSDCIVCLSCGIPKTIVGRIYILGTTYLIAEST